jgi:hypothetical protein
VIQILEHTPHEGPYAIGDAITSAGLPLRVCRTWAGDPVPDTLEAVAALVVMGDPTAAHEDFAGCAAELTLPVTNSLAGE